MLFRSQYIFRNSEPLPYRNNKNIYTRASDKVADSFEPIYNSKFNKQQLQNLETIRKTKRVVYRSPNIRISGVGMGEPFILNFIQADVAEV